MKAELRGLPVDLAAIVGRYLVAAELAKDPEQAYRFAEGARGIAARIGVVREVTGVAAYRAGHWSEALAELRAARRLTGRNDHLALMADSERALGRLDRALEVVHSDEARRLPRAIQVELRIVESGIRRDQGLADAAVLVLQLPELSDRRVRPWSARLFYAYGDALLAARRPEDAREAFSRAVLADENEETDALARLDELDGISVDDLEEDEDDWDEDESDLEDEDDLDAEDESRDVDEDAEEDEAEDWDAEDEDDSDLDAEDLDDDLDDESDPEDDDAPDDEDLVDFDDDESDEEEDDEEDTDDDEDDLDDELADEDEDSREPSDALADVNPDASSDSGSDDGSSGSSEDGKPSQ
ncbi:MAG TPA: hypothetical protein VGG75_07215 [Trebonia sp.]